ARSGREFAVPGDRGARWIPWALAAVLFGSLAVLVHPWYDPTSDGSIYIQTARALLDGDGYTLLGIPFIARPPGFAVLIAPILHFRGADFFALNLLTSACGAAAMLMFFLLRRRALGAAVAALLVLTLWLEPEVQQ